MHPWLVRYPNREKACFLINGFTNGFPLPSFSGEGCSVVGNLKSVEVYPQVVREKIFKEIEWGRVKGSFEYPPFKNFCISPLGVVPKHEPGSFRIIHHLSFSKGGSLNDDINGELCLVSYVTFEEAIIKIRL